MGRISQVGCLVAAGLVVMGCSGEEDPTAPTGMTTQTAWMNAVQPNAGGPGTMPPVVEPGPFGMDQPMNMVPGPMPVPPAVQPAAMQGPMPGGEPACDAGALDSDSDGAPDCDDGCPEDAMKTEPGVCGCGQAEPATAADGCGDGMDPGDPGVGDDPDPTLCAVMPIPDDLRDEHGLDRIYTRYASARGVPVVGTDAPQDEALRRACMMVRDLSAREDILETMLARHIGLVVMGADETSADLPEFARFGVPDSRARGLGTVPRGLCAEENIMCDRTRDRWRGESICLHEFAHTMHIGVYSVIDRTFDGRVREAYQAAIAAGKYANTYAASQPAEYFAEAAQDWYNTNLESARPNGVHNHINTRAELLEYDPAIYDILAEVLPDEPSYRDCYYYE